MTTLRQSVWQYLFVGRVLSTSGRALLRLPVVAGVLDRPPAAPAAAAAPPPRDERLWSTAGLSSTQKAPRDWILLVSADICGDV